MQDVPRSLLKDAASGDLSAFEHVYRITSGFVYSVALRMTHNVEDAQDITQDVFLKIHRKLKSFRFRASFKTWVYRITINTALNMCRKRSKQSRKSREFEKMLKITEVQEDIRSQIDKKESEERLEFLLELLKPEQRAVMVLREIEGLSYKEIARTLKINVNTVRTRLLRARAILYTVGKKEVDSEEV